MSILATDNFTRTNNADLGAAWDRNTAEISALGFHITSNQAFPDASDCSETNNSATWPDDQYAQVTLGPTFADGVGPGVGPIVRSAQNALTYFQLRVNASGYRVRYKIAGVSTNLVDSTAVTFADGDTAYLSVRTVGANTNWVVKKNGTQIDSGSLATPIASGRPGILYSSTSSGAVSIRAFEAGDFAAGGPDMAAVGAMALTSSAAPTLPAAPAFDLTINFRATSGYVTDGANSTYCLEENYPVTRGGGTFGFEDSIVSNSRDRVASAPNAPRLAGINFAFNTGAAKRFRLTLPGTGTYRVEVAIGDPSNGQVCDVQLRDDVTTFATLSGSSSVDQYVDASGVMRTSAANWLASQVQVTRVFASTILRVVLNASGTTTSGASCLATLRVVSVVVNEFSIVNESTSLDGGLTIAGSPYTIASAGTPVTQPHANACAGLVVVGQTTSGQDIIAYVPEGGALTPSGTAAGLRIFVGFSTASFSSGLTTQAKAVVDAAIDMIEADNATVSASLVATGAMQLSSSAVLKAPGKLAGVGTSVLTTSAVLKGAGVLRAVGASTLSSSAVLKAIAQARAVGASQLTTSAALKATGNIVGGAIGAMQLTTSAALKATGKLAGAGASQLTTSAVLTAAAASDMAAVGAMQLSSSAALKATGKLVAVGAMQLTANAAGSSAGKLVAAGASQLTTSAVLKAPGKLAGVGALTLTTSAALKAPGKLAGAGASVLSSSAVLKAVGQLRAVGASTLSTSAAGSAIGKLAGAVGAMQLTSPNANLVAGSSTSMNAQGQLTLSTSAAIKGTIGTLAVGAMQLTSVAHISTPGKLDAVGALTSAGSAARISSAGKLVAAGAMQLTTAAVIRSVGKLAGAGASVLTSAAVLKAAGVLRAVGASVLTSAAVLKAPGKLAAVGALTLSTSAALRAIGRLVGAVGAMQLTTRAELADAGSSSMAATGALNLTTAARISSPGKLVAVGTLTSATGTAARISSAGRLVAVGALRLTSSAVGTALLNTTGATGSMALSASATMRAPGKLVGAGAMQLTSIAHLQGGKFLSAAGSMAVTSSAQLKAIARLNGFAVLQLGGAARLVGRGELAATGTMVITGDAGLYATDPADIVHEIDGIVVFDPIKEYNARFDTVHEIAVLFDRH